LNESWGGKLNLNESWGGKLNLNENWGGKIERKIEFKFKFRTDL
jgi:hypothetical protein